MIGPGKYDDVATAVQNLTDADALLLFLLNGRRGDALTVHVKDPAVLKRLPGLLRAIADLMEETREPAADADKINQLFKAAKG